VAEVPQHQRAGVVREARDLGGVGDPRRAVRDVAEHEQRRVGPDDLGDLLGVMPVAGSVSTHRTVSPRSARPPRRRSGRSGSCRCRRRPRAAGLRVDGGPDELVEQDRRRVGDDDLAGPGPERRAPSRSPSDERPLEPLVGPPADEPPAPLLPHERVHALGRRASGRPSELPSKYATTGRVVDAEEPAAQVRQRVGVVQPACLVGEVAHELPISVRTAYSSGKKVSSRALRRKPTPLEPPVPRLKPMVRSTVLTWRNRHSWKFSSRSTSSSQVSYASQCSPACS
jgi:hypothetical protein